MRKALVLLLVGALPAVAGEVFLNNVNVTGVTNQTFEKAKVRIDGRGDVYIEAPGYSVQKVSVGNAQAQPVSEGTLSRKYFLVTEQAVPGMAEYNIELFINSRFIRTLKSSDEQIVADITKYLHPGGNTVTLQAKKTYANPNAPRSHSKAHFFRVIIGEGQAGGDSVVIENPLIRFDRTAADEADVAQEFTLTTR
jgi:hypothetical protein